MDPTKTAQPASPALPAAAPAVPQPPPESVSTSGIPHYTAPLVVPQPKQTLTPPATPTLPAPTPSDAKRSLIGRIFETLAGGERSEYQVDPTSGQMVETKVPLKPGEMFRGILAGALTGLAMGAGQRGPGAPLRAFSAGYLGRQQQLENQDLMKQQQAEQEFKNEGEAQTRLYQQHADARAQLASIRAGQEHDMQMKLWGVELQNGQFKHAQDIVALHEKQAAIWDNDQMLGIEPLKINGQPLPEFDSMADAEKYMQQHPNQMKSIINGFKSVLRVDPNTGKYVIKTMPPNTDVPRWWGAKMEDGKPVRDKNGDVEPDGTLKGPDGKPMAVFDTLDHVSAYTNRQLNNQYLSAETIRARAEAVASRATATERLRAVSKSSMLDAANTHFDEAMAAGGVDAVDPKTGHPFLSASERNLLANNYRLVVADDWTALKGAMTEAQSGNPPAGIDQNIQSLQKTFNSDLAAMNALRAPNFVPYVQNLNKQFGNDQAAKLNAVNANPNLSPENKQRVREMIEGKETNTGATTSSQKGSESPSESAEDYYQKWLQGPAKFSGSITPIELYEQIQKFPLSEQQRASLIKAHGAQIPWSAVQEMAAARKASPEDIATALKSQGFSVEAAPKPEVSFANPSGQ